VIWLIIGSVILCAATWGLVIGLSWEIWIAGLVTGTLVLIVLIVVAFRVVAARRRAAALERELMKQASKQAEQARPERRQEIIALQQQMSDAIRELQRSKLAGRGGKAALYALPWYVLIGPPAAGKTTALERSGLAFTSARGRRHKVQGVAGTRNCDWWFSEEAILLDTAGRFTTEDNDEPEWLAFLDLLKRFRPKRPLDGLIVAISCTDLLNGSAEQIDETAKKLRARLDELTRRLEMVLPVYVLLTKADLIAGFVEFWSDLSPQNRGQVWGATFDPDAEELSEPAAAVKAEFDVLTEVLHSRTLERINGDRVVQRRGRILQFPVEFTALRRPLARFIEELFRPSQYQETPLMRGFYFSSGTQVGSPVDRVVGGQAEDRGGILPRYTALRTSFDPQPQQTGNASYFVSDLLRKIIFPDRRLGTTSKVRVQRHIRKQLVIGAGLLGLTALIVIPAATSYIENLDLIDATALDVRETRLATGERLSSGSALEALDRLLARYQALEEASEQASISYWWGLYTAEPIRDATRGLYLERLRQTVEGPLREQLTAKVRSVGDLPTLDPDSFTAGYDALHLYLMMTNPDRLDAEWATNELTELWTRTTQRAVEPGGTPISSHVQSYVAQLAADKSWAWEEDSLLVERARSRLASMPVDVIAYTTLESAAKGAPPVRPEHIFVGNAQRFLTTKGKVEVPGLYTRLGWEKVRSLLDDDKKLHFAPWVLGQGGSSETSFSIEQLRDQYFQRYERAWKDFFLGLNVSTPSNLRGAIEELGALGKVDGPYVRLFRRFAENVRLEYPPPTLLEKIADKVEDKLEKKLDKKSQKLTGEKLSDGNDEPERKITPVERDFARLVSFGYGDTPPTKDTPASALPPSSLSQYLDALRNLEVSLKQIEEASIEPGEQFRSELERTAATVERLLTGLNQEERYILEPLLMNPIRGSQTAVDGAQGAQLNDRWRAEVWEAFRRMTSRYPFVSASMQDVPLPDFAEFFRPKTGTLWAFYEQNLSNRLLRQGTRFAPKPTERKSGFRGDFLACLAKAQEITDAVFRGDSPDPLVPFSVKMQAVGAAISEITLRVDGQSIVYRNEPERWQSMQWPGKEGPSGTSVQVRGAAFKDEIRRVGDFAFIRVLAEGGVKSIAPGSVDLEAAWDMSGQARVVIQFRPPASRHPFHKGFFSALQCPPAVLSVTDVEAAGYDDSRDARDSPDANDARGADDEQ
jgi:type VI secretion system protein ImpL